MRILVHPHELGIGGSQLNAVEIAAAVHRMGHPTIVFGRPGPLIDRVAALGLEFVEAPDPGRHPSRPTIRALRDLVGARDLDVLHGYEWPPALDCLLASRRVPAVAVGTVMSMSVAPFLPHSLPLAVGTDEIAAVERAAGRSDVRVIVPPVDLDANGPDVVLPGADFAATRGLDTSRATVVCVTRLARELKLEGLLAAMDAVGRLTAARPVRLVVVGDGPARAEVRERAERVNAAAGAGTVVLTGELFDPRGAYAAADVVLGMGGSALRAMAFAKPLVVQGELGFWRLLTPDSADTFERGGWYGRGTGAAAGADTLYRILGDLLSHPDECARLGRFGRTLVERRYSLDAAATAQLEMYGTALRTAHPRGATVPADLTAGLRYAAYQARRHAARALGRGAADDFNSRPVAASAPPPNPENTVVWMSGVSWDAVAGTDRHLVTALAVRRPVLWVDPPMSWWARRRRGITLDPVTRPVPGVVRVHTVAPPGVSRPVLRTLARRLMWRNTERALPRGLAGVAALVVTSPEPVLRHRPAARTFTVYYATDDFVAGAGLLGYSERYVRRARTTNLRAADLRLSVSERLAATLTLGGRVPVDVLPNGCDAERFAAGVRPSPDVVLPAPVAGVVGQLNDRVDVSALEAIADLGHSLLLVGPRHDRDPDVGRRLDAVIARDNVQWIDRQPAAALPAYYAALDVGVTAYTDTEFNRASHPLKTLEYLAAGLPVVSTDLPAARAFASDLVCCAADGPDIAQRVHRLLTAPEPPGRTTRCRELAAAHSWTARADRFEQLIAAGRPTEETR